MEVSRSELRQINLQEGRRLEKDAYPPEILDFMQRSGLAVERNDGVYCDFVGLLSYSNHIVRSWPKYLTNISSKDDEDFLLIIRVLWKFYNQSKFDHSSDSSTGLSTLDNSFGLSCQIIKDYLENGLYTVEDIIDEKAEIGEINWNKSFSVIQPYIAKNKPYYVELLFRHNNENPNNFLTQVHKSVLSEIFNNFDQLGLLKILNLPSINFRSLELKSLGSKEELCLRIQKEAREHFDDRSRNLLALLLSYICNKSYKKNSPLVYLFATTSFNLIWEKVCATIFCDLQNQSVSILGLKNGKRLKDFVQGPQWKIKKEAFTGEKMRLDMILLSRSSNGRINLIVADAKYYDLNHSLPGVEDVVKQHVYELFFHHLKQQGIIHKISNCFIFPIDKNDYSILGTVNMPIMRSYVKSDIKLIAYPATQAFRAYIANINLSLPL